MEVTFYGVRGSCPCAGEEYRHYGGNTSCIRVADGGSDPIILDLGTGLRRLGEDLARERVQADAPFRASVLLTHLHFDHLFGLPFFRPLREPGGALTIYGPAPEGETLAQAFARLVQPPFFPIQLSQFGCRTTLVDTGEDTWALGGAKVQARWVPHLGPTLGFRIEMGGRTLAYLPDHQAPSGARSPIPDGALELCDQADLVIHDAQYTDDELAEKAEWGHASASFAVRVAAEAGARRLVLFHHDPGHDDRTIDAIAAAVERSPGASRLERIEAAREGSTIDLGCR